MAFVKLSPTKVATWIDCPRRYYFTYVLRERSGKSWAHLSFGNSIHAALRGWFELPLEQRSPASVADLVQRVWIDAGYRDAEQSEKWRDRATQMVGDYLAELDPTFEPVSTERTLAFKTDTFIMEGRIDRIDRYCFDDGHESEQVSIVDYKTGRSVPSIDEVRGSSALAMYALMVQRAAGMSCFEVSLHHVPTGTTVSWRHTPATLQRQLDRMSQIAEDIALAQDTFDATEDQLEARDHLFPARPSALCGFCDFWEVCETGQRFTTRKNRWDGLGS